MTFTIVPISEQHIEGYCAAVDSVAREGKYLAFLEGPALEMSREFVLGNLREGHPHFVALIDGGVVGWCDIGSLHRPVFSHAGVLGMGVLASHRSQGIGKALIQAALEKARNIGLTRVELTVREENNRAKALYEKSGFIVEGIHRNAVKIGEKYENHLSMAVLFQETA